MLGKNRSGYPAWKEYTDMGGFLIFEALDMQPPKNLVVSMRKSTIGMTGTWSYTLKPEGDTTLVVIKEQSRITSVPVRTMMTLSGRDWNLKAELRLMQKHFNKSRKITDFRREEEQSSLLVTNFAKYRPLFYWSGGQNF